MLAGITPDLGKALVLEQAAAAGVAMDGVEDCPPGGVFVPAFVNEFANDSPA